MEAVRPRAIPLPRPPGRFGGREGLGRGPRCPAGLGQLPSSPVFGRRRLSGHRRLLRAFAFPLPVRFANPPVDQVGDGKPHAARRRRGRRGLRPPAPIPAKGDGGSRGGRLQGRPVPPPRNARRLGRVSGSPGFRSAGGPAGVPGAFARLRQVHRRRRQGERRACLLFAFRPRMPGLHPHLPDPPLWRRPGRQGFYRAGSLC